MTPMYHDWLPSERRFLGDWPPRAYIAIVNGQNHDVKNARARNDGYKAGFDVRETSAEHVPNHKNDNNLII